MSRDFYYFLSFVFMIIAGLAIDYNGGWRFVGLLAAYAAGICVTVNFPVPEGWVNEDE